MLANRVRRWARAAEAEGQDTEAGLHEGLAAARRVAAAMVAAGAVDDAGFAAARARRLARSGRSRRARRMAWRACRTASEVTAQVLTITASVSPAASAWPRMTSDS